MPKFRKLEGEELSAVANSRKVDLGPYLAWLGGLESGQGGEIALDREDNRRSVMRRLRKAAYQLGLVIRFRTLPDPRTIVFEVWKEADIANPDRNP